jgi:hypothetical protein
MINITGHKEVESAHRPRLNARSRIASIKRMQRQRVLQLQFQIETIFLFLFLLSSTLAAGLAYLKW